MGEGDKIITDIQIQDRNSKAVINKIQELAFNLLSGDISKEFEKNFVGLNKFDKISFEFCFPENFKKFKNVEGKTVLVNAHVKSIKRYGNPMKEQDMIKKYG